MRLLILCLLLWVLAPGPAAAEAPAENILIIFDESGSMEFLTDPVTGRMVPAPEKFQQALDALLRYVTDLPDGTRIGLRTFGDAAYSRGFDGDVSQLIVPVGKDGGRKIFEASRKFRPLGGTPIGHALRGAIQDLAGLEGSLALVLISDGQGNDPIEDLAAARELAEMYPHLRGHTIDMGADDSGKAELAEIARVLQGQALHADHTTLEAALHQIGRTGEGQSAPPSGATRAGSLVLLLVTLAVLLVAVIAGARANPTFVPMAALCAAGGAASWAVSEPFQMATQQALAASPRIAAALYFVVVGAVLGSFLGAVDGLLRRAWARAAVGARMGAMAGAIGGLAGSLLGQPAYAFLRGEGDPGLLREAFARSVGWAVVGGALGKAPGISALSMPKVLRGLLGGVCGGFAGGLCFDPIAHLLGAGMLSRLGALSLLGAAIGVAVNLVEELAKKAWVIIARGYPEGHQFVIEKETTWIGSNELLDIPLFRDPAMASRHARIVYRDSGYVIEMEEGPVLVDGKEGRSFPLRDGSIIDLASYRLLFRTRLASGEPAAARPPASPPRPPPDAEPVDRAPAPEAAPAPPAPAAPPAPPAPACRKHASPAGSKPVAAPKMKGWGRLTALPPDTGLGSFSLEADEVTVGRAEDRDLRIDEGSVAPFHALLKRIQDRPHIFARKTETGTYLNGKEIQGKVSLEHGDVLTLGKVKLRFESHDGR